mmetsp:Transcript_12150/g.26530  ORF Transcript_12150/g.26530 Transcript_12150/m.26530 type:complete len:200 (+) Transcript_12150:875-1474(+)
MSTAWAIAWEALFPPRPPEIRPRPECPVDSFCPTRAPPRGPRMEAMPISVPGCLIWKITTLGRRSTTRETSIPTTMLPCRTKMIPIVLWLNSVAECSWMQDKLVQHHLPRASSRRAFYKASALPRLQTVPSQAPPCHSSCRSGSPRRPLEAFEGSTSAPGVSRRRPATAAKSTNSFSNSSNPTGIGASSIPKSERHYWD